MLLLHVFSAAGAVIYIKRKPEYMEIGKKEGHIICTTQKNKFRWIIEQLRIAKDKTKTGCTHLRDDIAAGIKFDYMSAKIIAATVQGWLVKDVKFTANFHAPTSNKFKTTPASK